MVASAEDEVGSRIGMVQLAAPFAVVHNVAAAAVAFSGSSDPAVADHIVPFVDIETKPDPSLSLRYSVRTEGDSQTWAAPSLLAERLTSGASRRIGVRLNLADASIPDEVDSSRLIVREKDG